MDMTRERGWQHRVALGHMTHLSTLSLKELVPIARNLHELGISIIALPASDVCMMARSDDGNRRRGVCPVEELASLGVNACYATNNVQNLFTFTGDGDVLKVGTLVCQMLQMTSSVEVDMCLQMATIFAAKALGVSTHGIEVGNPADLVLLDGCSTAMEVFAAPPVGRTVLKKGKVVATSVKHTSLHL